MAVDYKYPVKYKIVHGAFSRDELAQDNAGGCDQFGLISVIGKFGEGPLSTALVGVKDDGSEWSDDNWFKVWSLIAHKLAKSTDLSQAKREFASEVFETIRAAILAAQG